MYVIERIDLMLNEVRATTKGKGVTWEEAKKLEKQIARALQPDMRDTIRKTTMGYPDKMDAWELMYRVYELFTARSGEEDDDWPDFTKKDQANLNRAIKPILKGIGYEVQTSEKYWLSIYIKAKKLTKKDQRAEAKKATELVAKALRWAEIDTHDKFDKEKYNETAALIKKKHRNKFIKKEVFYELAKKANFRWGFDNDELDEFWRDIK